MNTEQGRNVVDLLFAAFPGFELTQQIRDVWWNSVLRTAEFEESIRIAQILAATSDKPPTPKTFIDYQRGRRPEDSPSQYKEKSRLANYEESQSAIAKARQVIEQQREKAKAKI